MGDKGEPLPLWIREEILSRVSDKELAEEALNYLSVRERNGKPWVVEELPDTSNHALLLAVHTCMGYAQRLLRGENLDDP